MTAVLSKLYFFCTGIVCLFSPFTIMAAQFELLRDDNSSIHFYLNHSNAIPQDALLILLQGSDCNSVDNNISLNTDLPKMFPDADVLTVEKYGLTNRLPYSKEDVRSDGCPSEYVKNNSPKQRVKDLQQVVDHLLSIRNYKYIIVLGASEGALVGEMFTAKNPKVTALISLVGGADHLLDDMHYNLTQTVPPEELAQQQADFDTFIEQIATAKEPIFMGEDNELGFKWFKSILSLSRYDFLSQITQPVLLIDCGRDSNTSPIESDKLYQRLQEHNKSNITRIIYPELDHFFTNRSGERVLDKVIFDGRQWLSSSIKRTYIIH